MKTKTLARKLSLSKETIANLSQLEMEELYGGIDDIRTAIGIGSGCKCGTGSAPGNCC